MASPIELESFVIDQIRCPECSLTCLQKNIYRHMTQIHSWSTDDCKSLVAAIRTEKKKRETNTSFVCAYCRVLFRSLRHLVQHKRICVSQRELVPGEEENDGLDGIFMGEMIVEGEEEVGGIDDYQELEDREDGESTDDIQQQEESEKPSTSSNIRKFNILENCFVEGPPHRARQIQAHHLSSSLRNPAHSLSLIEKQLKFPLTGRHRGLHLQCPECVVTVESVEDFLSHCREKHETDERKFDWERQIFGSKDEFKKWFDQRQEDTCTSLTKRTGHGGETLYRCHRVGKYRSVAKSRKSNPRKIDQTCTAFLKVTTDEDGTTWAHGCFTHIGHTLDHKLLWLTESQENYVRELIDLGWTSDQIFFFIRSEYKEYECKLKYVSKNDIRNITVRYNREKDKIGYPLERKLSSDEIARNLLALQHGATQLMNGIQQQKSIEEEEEIVVEDLENEDDEEGVPAKMARFESQEEPRIQEIEEESVIVEEIIGREEEVVEEEIVTSSTVAEEDEYINVVDDDTMPELI